MALLSWALSITFLGQFYPPNYALGVYYYSNYYTIVYIIVIIILYYIYSIYIIYTIYIVYYYTNINSHCLVHMPTDNRYMLGLQVWHR